MTAGTTTAHDGKLSAQGPQEDGVIAKNKARSRLRELHGVQVACEKERRRISRPVIQR